MLGKYFLFIFVSAVFSTSVLASDEACTLKQGECSPDLAAIAEGIVNTVKVDPIHPHLAAKMVFNTFYQSCESLNKPVYDTLEHGEMRGLDTVPHEFNGGKISRIQDLDDARNSQYYLNCDKSPPSSCRDLCKAPPTYLWGGKGLYEKNESGIKLNLFANTSDIQNEAKHPGIDCSGFVNAAFAVAGLRVDSDKNPVDTAKSVGAKHFMKLSDCFSTVTPKKKNFFKPGDVIAWQKHVVMVDSSDADPFGLDSIKSVSKCTNKHIDPTKFSLTILNARGGLDAPTEAALEFEKENAGIKEYFEKIKSKTTGVGVGVSKMRFGDFVLSYPVEVMELAKAACYAKFGKHLPLTSVRIARHKLITPSNNEALNAQCKQNVDDKVTLEGQKCVQNCKI